MEERFTAASRPGPRPEGSFGDSSGALQDTAPSLLPGPSNLPTALRLGELQVPREKARVRLYLSLPMEEDHSLHGPFAECSPGEEKGYPLQYSVYWGRKESDTTERLSLSSMFSLRVLH